MYVLLSAFSPIHRVKNKWLWAHKPSTMDGLQGDPLQDPVSELFVSSTVDDGFETLTLIDKGMFAAVNSN